MEKPHIFSKTEQACSTLKTPLAELAGYNRVLIENHMGVLAYSTQEIQIKVQYGRLTINGCDLRLLQLSKE